MTNQTETNSTPQVEQDRAMINEARAKGKGPLFWAFTKLSGPGWLQSAITLGGGSLGGSLYLGVLSGYSLMWLQPIAMLMGIVMLSAIGYIALSTGERPFRAINKHISPVLGWGWILATVMANFVWCMPQFTLGTAAIQQNLAPAVLGDVAINEAVSEAGLTDEDEISALRTSEKFKHNLICASILFICAAIVVLFYDSGGWGIKLFEILLKCLVGLVVISFFGVVIKMSLEGLLDWGKIFSGFIPDFSTFSRPSDAFTPLLEATGDFRDFWVNRIVNEQQGVMITAAATAVGINMTFLLPYSMLQRGWDKDFRGLAIFDLSTGLLIPFMLATGCVVLASATQFHGKPEKGLVELYIPTENAPAPAGNLVKGFKGILNDRLAKGKNGEEVEKLLAELKNKKTSDARKGEINTQLEEWRGELPEGDLRMAAALVKRDNMNLANSLEGLVGKTTAQTVFGIGVFGMAISTIIILMLINGFAICEMFGVEPHGWPHRLGAISAGLVGSLGPFFWSKAAAYLVVPTSKFGMALLPIAYWTFFFMMNSKALLGDSVPKGFARVRWNVLMLIAASAATFGSLFSIYHSGSTVRTIGFISMGIFVVLIFVTAAKKRQS